MTRKRSPFIFEKDDNGCLICISHKRKHKRGYTQITVKDNNGKYKVKRLHRILYEKKYGELPKSISICHKCDNTSCCNIEHLYAGTQKDNVNDRYRRLRDNDQRKISFDETISIFVEETISEKYLSLLYGLQDGYVHKIRDSKNGLGWSRHLAAKLDEVKGGYQRSANA